MSTNTLLEPTQEQAAIESKLTSGTFEQFQLPKFLSEGLRRLNFQHPTLIQAQSIPPLMDGQDLIAQSATGSGKTAAFAIPMLARIQRQSRDLQGLILVPTRELALQVTQVFKALAGPAVRVTPIYGGAGMQGQIRGLTQGGYQVVVGTPGRVRDHLNRGTIRLDRIRMLVLDEADEMLDRGFAQDVEAIVYATPAMRQTALFSATLPDWVKETANKHLRPNHATVTIVPDGDSKPDIEQVVYDMSLPDKLVALRYLLDTLESDSLLVFARTKHGVKKLAARLEAEGYSAAGLQGNLSQRAREEVMAAFRAKAVRVLVATNVGARGLDISGITHVINFDLPESPELFTHRTGRTGRNGASGTAITFLTGEDRAKWREIEQAMKKAGVDFVRQPWDGPRAQPGADTVIVQPVQGQFRRNAGRSDFEERGPRRQFENNGPRENRNSAPRRPQNEGEFKPRRESDIEFKPRRQNEGEFRPRREDFAPRRDFQREDGRTPNRDDRFSRQASPVRSGQFEGGSDNSGGRNGRRDFGRPANGNRRNGGFGNQNQRNSRRSY